MFTIASCDARLLPADTSSAFYQLDRFCFGDGGRMDIKVTAQIPETGELRLLMCSDAQTLALRTEDASSFCDGSKRYQSPHTRAHTHTRAGWL